jgi:hypothetical protein
MHVDYEIEGREDFYEQFAKFVEVAGEGVVAFVEGVLYVEDEPVEEILCEED